MNTQYTTALKPLLFAYYRWWPSDVGRRGRQAHEHTAQGELPVGAPSGRPGESPVQETATGGDYFGSQDVRPHTDPDQIGRHHNVSTAVGTR